MVNETSIANRPPTDRARARDSYSFELEQWLCAHESLLGVHSTFESLMESIKRGATSGNSGTKGCGRTVAEPFERWKNLRDVHGAIDRASRCERAFRRLTDDEREIACARYLVLKKALPAGLDAKFGHLAAVVVVVARQSNLLAEFWEDMGRKRFQAWRIKAETALRDTHTSWFSRRAAVDDEIEAGRTLARQSWEDVDG